MNIENDEVYTYPIRENFVILYSTKMNKWAVEIPGDSFTIDENSFIEDIVYNKDILTLKDFHKAQSIILKRIKNEKAV